MRRSQGRKPYGQCLMHLSIKYDKSLQANDDIDNPGLPLQTEAPVRTPNGVDFSFPDVEVANALQCCLRKLAYEGGMLHGETSSKR